MGLLHFVSFFSLATGIRCELCGGLCKWGQNEIHWGKASASRRHRYDYCYTATGLLLLFCVGFLFCFL
jgi:hypothetical protein